MGWIISLVMLMVAIFSGEVITAGEIVIAAGLFAIAGGIATAGLAVKEAFKKKD